MHTLSCVTTVSSLNTDVFDVNSDTTAGISNPAALNVFFTVVPVIDSHVKSIHQTASNAVITISAAE